MTYKIIRSRRKTLALRINEKGEVEALAPMKLSASVIDRAVTGKADWIEQKSKERRAAYEKRAAFEVDYGGMARYRGAEYPIIERGEKFAGFDGDAFYMPSNLTPEQIKATLIAIYKKLAKNLLTERVRYYAKLMNVVPIAVKINSAKTRWGSCSGKDSINFTWRLITGSDSVIDYVVVHELAHIREHNHSAAFYAVVESAMPDWQSRELQLKELQKALAAEDWD